MYNTQLLFCIALSLALVISSVPTSTPAEEAREQLQQVLLDLQVLLRGVNSNKNPKLSRMLTFKFYTPKRATDLRHLQCLEEELKPLEGVLNLGQSKTFHLRDSRDLISNINVTVLKLKGSETFLCDYEDKAATIVEFLSRWITFCQGIISTLI
ncbi:interleukin-2 [Perognathus longimembris pacificus]|uniref:interleukin-2 n=1 Tax=Perognathus longimembris pacificus TaxID=214514 RepID=UPI00201A1F73|nr:interleukin-2 [Perognathus longimembris pacificus]